MFKKKQNKYLLIDKALIALTSLDFQSSKNSLYLNIHYSFIFYWLRLNNELRTSYCEKFILLNYLSLLNVIISVRINRVYHRLILINKIINKKYSILHNTNYDGLVREKDFLVLYLYYYGCQYRTIVNHQKFGKSFMFTNCKINKVAFESIFYLFTFVKDPLF